MPTQEQINLALQKGYTPQQIQLALARAGQIQPKKKTIGGFLGNVLSSGVRTVGDVAGAVLNPIETGKSVWNLGTGAAQLLLPGEQGNEQYARAVGDFYKNRYGSLENIGNTLYNDPVGAVMDASSVFGGSGSLLKGAGKVSKINSLTKAGTALSRAGDLIDPIAAVGRGVGKVTRGVGRRLAPLAKDVGKEFAVRSVRANPTQLEDFKEISGMDLSDYMVNEELYGGGKRALNQSLKQSKPFQKKYNKLTRTGKTISRGQYIENLRQQALSILETDQSPAARNMAEAVWKEADKQERLGSLTDTILTNSKSSSYAKAPKGSLQDATVMNFNKEIGNVGANTLEQLAQGSRDLGKKLQIQRAFQDIASKQSQLGRGAQIINAFKPIMSGITGGGIVGTGFAPGIGTLIGSTIGGVTAFAANNPSLQGAAAKVLTKGKLPKIPGQIPATGRAVYKVGTIGRMLNPSTQQLSASTQQISKKSPMQSLPSSIPQQNKPVATQQTTPVLPKKLPKLPPPTISQPKNNQSMNFYKPVKLKRSSAY
jgi:hypothetical protein